MCRLAASLACKVLRANEGKSSRQPSTTGRPRSALVVWVEAGLAMSQISSFRSSTLYSVCSFCSSFEMTYLRNMLITKVSIAPLWKTSRMRQNMDHQCYETCFFCKPNRPAMYR